MQQLSLSGKYREAIHIGKWIRKTVDMLRSSSYFAKSLLPEIYQRTTKEAQLAELAISLPTILRSIFKILWIPIVLYMQSYIWEKLPHSYKCMLTKLMLWPISISCMAQGHDDPVDAPATLCPWAELIYIFYMYLTSTWIVFTFL